MPQTSPGENELAEAFNKAMRQNCKHPPARLYSWWACGDDGPERSVLCIACCACGKVLKGAA